jgi:hypothetical protein
VKHFLLDGRLGVGVGEREKSFKKFSWECVFVDDSQNGVVEKVLKKYFSPIKLKLFSLAINLI